MSLNSKAYFKFKNQIDMLNVFISKWTFIYDHYFQTLSIVTSCTYTFKYTISKSDPFYFKMNHELWTFSSDLFQFKIFLIQKEIWGKRNYEFIQNVHSVQSCSLTKQNGDRHWFWAMVKRSYEG